MDILKWIQELDRSNDFRPQWAEVERLFARGERDTLVEIARECGHNDLQQAGRRSIWQRIIELLALSPGRANIETLCRIYEVAPAPNHTPPWPKPNRARSFASILAQEQEVGELLALGEWAGDIPKHRELVACCAQELVTRGRAGEKDFDEATATRALLETHPLGVLPLRLLETEQSFPGLLPHYRASGMSHGFGGASALSTMGNGQARTIRRLEENVELLHAVRNWSEESNGLLDAGAFGLEPSLEVGDFGARVLRDSGLDATADVQAPRLITFASALEILFSAACAGGAYNAGERGAWGRLATWRSVGALVGLDDAASIEKINEEALSCAWLDFAGQGDWFNNIAWDVGIACLRRDGKSLAIVAATDTD